MEALHHLYTPPPVPPYPQMIWSAITALDEQNGSNKTSISKFIESTYGDLPAGHSQLLSHHLNRMKETGELVFWKNNYMKPDPNAPPRRGRGRPPKSSKVTPPTGSVEEPGKPNAPPKPVKPKPAGAAGSGRPRGRPRKIARTMEDMHGTTTSSSMAMAGGS
ncbi:HMG-Y-related protein A-like [Mercurialis annua]|uniref:HMG-Y-related protein A-like n=1 Tax=Mercurialis annua TaxID=3986 RepID=UPI0021609D38|nr:HMG-Y-related protein A-like [Mercurialis annua]